MNANKFTAAQTGQELILIQFLITRNVAEELHKPIIEKF